MTRLGDGSVPDILLRLNEVCARVSLSRTTIYKLMNEGRFPRPLRLGPGSVRWKSSEIEAWIASLERS